MGPVGGQSHLHNWQVALSRNGKKYTRYHWWRQDWGAPIFLASRQDVERREASRVGAQKQVW